MAFSIQDQSVGELVLVGMAWCLKLLVFLMARFTASTSHPHSVDESVVESRQCEVVVGVERMMATAQSPAPPPAHGSASVPLDK